METHPLQAGPLYTAYKDLALAVEWQDLRIVPLEGTEWVCIVGHKRKEVSLWYFSDQDQGLGWDCGCEWSAREGAGKYELMADLCIQPGVIILWDDWHPA